MSRFWLILLLAAQIDVPRPAFVYNDGTACFVWVSTWTNDHSEVLSIKLPGYADDINSRTFQVGTGRAKTDVQIFFRTPSFHRCGEDLGAAFENVVGYPDWTAVDGSAFVFTSKRGTVTWVTVVLRDVTFKSSKRQFTIPGPVRITAVQNNSVAG